MHLELSSYIIVWLKLPLAILYIILVTGKSGDKTTAKALMPTTTSEDDGAPDRSK